MQPAGGIWWIFADRIPWNFYLFDHKAVARGNLAVPPPFHLQELSIRQTKFTGGEPQARFVEI
jgi:hypothetical protein